MNTSSNTAHRELGHSVSLQGAKGKENKRSRALGPVDMNVNGTSGRHHVASEKFAFILPRSPNPTLKKKTKSSDVDRSEARYLDPSSNVSRNSLQANEMPKNDTSDPDAILDSFKKMTIEDEPALQKELDELFVKQSQERMKGVPMIDMPEILAKNGIELFDHQKEGIRWLTHKEVTNKDVPPYYKWRKYGPYSRRLCCTLNNQVWRYEHEPEPLRHSILADDMGLGKTLQSIGLILSNPPAGRDGIRSYPYQMPREGENMPPNCTIIVSPVSVMSTWKSEIDKFVHNKNKDILNVEMYHGAKRVGVLRKVQEGKVDVLLCSYQTLGSDFKKYRKIQAEKAKMDFASDENSEDDSWAFLNNNDPSLFDLNFHRIILDEAHMIRNSGTLYAKGVNSLVATHKLCLTGTPFVNHPRDIFPFLDFLDVAPYNDIRSFNQNVVETIEQRKEIGLARLRVLLGAIAIRRTKAEVGKEIQLPEKRIHIRKIVFPEDCEHKQISEMMYRVCRAGFIALADGDDGDYARFFGSLFGLVMRTRQSCCDARLIPVGIRQEMASVWEEYRNVDLDNLDSKDGLHLCERVLGALATAKERNGDETKSIFNRPPKVQALMDAIAEMKRSEKAVICSQWTKFLDIIQSELKAEGHSFVRIDGSMTAIERYEAMEAFNADGPRTMRGPRFILCSLTACNTGITLTRANHIFLMDTWWNAAEENQAMDRVHRIGQVRKVRVIRFIMNNSIEERFVEVQDAKEALAKGSMERLKKEDRRKASVTALKDLFEMKARDHVWEGTFVDDDEGINLE